MTTANRRRLLAKLQALATSGDEAQQAIATAILSIDASLEQMYYRLAQLEKTVVRLSKKVEPKPKRGW